MKISTTDSVVDAHQSIRPELTRRLLLAGSLLLLVGYAVASPQRHRNFTTRLAAVQSGLGGRLGVSMLDTGSGQRLEFNADTRFPLCSTFKLLLAANILAKMDSHELALDQRLSYTAAELIAHSPVTLQRVAEGSLAIGELCAAMVEVSDNTAANLLLDVVGGPAGLTAFLRSIDDASTRLDRREPELNTSLPGDPRDTTTPSAMTATLQRLLTGSALSAGSREQLSAWLKDSQTGLHRLRAGLPANWVAGDKTGTGANGTVNDVMIAWPPGRPPIIAAVYCSESVAPLRELERAHAQIGAWIAEFIAG